MAQATVGFLDSNGNWVPVTASAGLPVSGGSTGPTVTSVNGQTGEVVLDAADVGALPDTYTPPAAPVSSVNGETGAVVLAAADVGAAATTHTHAAADVTSGTFAAARIPNLAISKVTNLQTSLDAKQDSLPAAPSTGTYALQSVEGVLTWVEVV